jgi:integrase/recombinase XerD
MNPDVTTAIILDKRRIRKDKKYRVKLRITHERIQKYYPTKFTLTEMEFELINTPQPRGNFKVTKLILSDIEKQAKQVVNDLPQFSFEAFERHYKNPKGSKNLNSFYDTYIKDLKKEGRAGTVHNYQTSIKSLTEFNKGRDLTFGEITPAFLFNYEKWMLNKGNSITSVGIYTRPLRAIFNKAIRDRIISDIVYPFGKDKFQIPEGRNIKKALKLADIEQLYNHQTIPNSPEDRAKDLWFFSYLCNGINVKDICRLKYSNLDFNEGKITFIRAKTELTRRRNLKAIEAIITDEVKTIIDKWGNYPQNPETYVFPILTEGLSPEKELAIIRQAGKTINKYMKRIAESLGIKLHVTTYTARHSYSTILKQSGVSIEFISENLGHSDLRTTENYLDSFDLDSKKEVAKNLLNFPKKKE